MNARSESEAENIDIVEFSMGYLTPEQIHQLAYLQLKTAVSKKIREQVSLQGKGKEKLEVRKVLSEAFHYLQSKMSQPKAATYAEHVVEQFGVDPRKEKVTFSGMRLTVNSIVDMVNRY